MALYTMYEFMLAVQRLLTASHLTTKHDHPGAVWYRESAFVSSFSGCVLLLLTNDFLCAIIVLQTFFVYTYNSDGLRTYQAVTEDGISTITQYVWGNNGLAAVIYEDKKVIPLYDNAGDAIGFAVVTENADPQLAPTEEIYTYVKNLQGDVIRILDKDGTDVVVYTYDPWGVPEVYGDSDLAAINPCSYRGYYYDEETGYYYLQSRYYDPENGRFINPDEPLVVQLSSSTFAIANIFSYCNNNPVHDSDATGYLSFNSLLSKIKEIVQKVANYLSSYVKSLFVYNSATKTLSIRGVVVSSAVDAICILLMRSAVYNGLKYGMKVLLQNNTIRKEFVKQMFDFFVNTWGGKLILKTLVTIGFAVAGVRWSESVKNAYISDLISDIACQKFSFLSAPASLISAFSSFGGIVAFFFDLMDGSWNDYITIRLL